MRKSLLLAIPLLFPLVTPQTIASQTISGIPTDTVQPFISAKPQSNFPDMGSNFIETVQKPAEAARQAEADRIAKEAADAEAARQAAAVSVFQAPPSYANAYSGTLTGSIGYSAAGGNCVDTARAYGKVQDGNPINWYVTGHAPFIGAAALFYFNHVAVVVGIWSNGDIEVAQSNSAGAPHRYSQSEIRGYF